MGWTELAKRGGRQIDQFDNKHTVHMLYIEHGEVLGYQRLLPSTRPHLLSEVTPQLCEVERPVGADIWEISRHCVAPGHRTGGHYASPIANALGSGLLEWALECAESQSSSSRSNRWGCFSWSSFIFNRYLSACRTRLTDERCLR
ncbi:MAG: acyl-homoserine-lactone synthase [Methylocella sp.]